MRITVSSRFSPFSHECGERFLFPETGACIQVFPTRLIVSEEEGASSVVDFSWQGPVREFTAKLDLEKKELNVFGFSKEGYFSYRLIRRETSLVLIIDKIPAALYATSLFSVPIPLEKHREIPLFTLGVVKTVTGRGRLSLGSHKQQDFSKMKKRLDPCELIPLWIQMGALCPDLSSSEKQGPFALLATLGDLILKEKKCDLIQAALSFFLASFHGVFVPRLIDEDYQGIVKGIAQGSSLPLLTYSATLLSSLFYRESSQRIEILPLLPPELHCGRWIDIPLQSGVILDFEWTKKTLCKVFLKSSEEKEVTLLLPKGISACRITGKKGMVKKMRIEGGLLPLSLEKGGRVTIDRFLRE